MNDTKIKPIRYTAREVALMRKVARFFNPQARPSYKAFGLVREGRKFVWMPR